MNAKEILSKYKPVIIVILLFSMMFFLRGQSVYLSGVPDQMKPIYQDESGLPYFSEMDSYYNYRLTKNFLDHGYLGDKIINGTDWDLHSYYPPGRAVDYPPLIVYFTAFFYKFINLFGAVSLTTVCFWMAAFVASLCVIPAYFFVRRITNDFGGITAGILVGTAPTYFSHTFAGFFDTDMFNMLLPLLIVWFFVEAIYTKNIKMRTFFVLLSTIFMLLFSMAWVGWWYMFYLIILIVVVHILISKYLLGIEIIKPIKEYSSKITWFLDQSELFSLVVFIIVSSFFVGCYLGFSKFVIVLFEPFGFTKLQALVQTTAYPNVYVSVSELQIPSLWDVISGVGGIVAFVFGIISILMLIWQFKEKEVKKDNSGENKVKRKGKRMKKSKRKEKIEKNIMEKKKDYLLYTILLSIWLLVTAYAMTKGVRFVATFSLPIALGAGIFVGFGVKYLRRYIKDPQYCSVAALLLIAFIVYPSVSGAYSISTSVVPGTDDFMWNSLEWIGENTPKETVVTSWWDFGHLFAVVANRPVTFDGGTQNTPRAYWVGKALLTNNESLSVGILRMLTTSGDEGYLTLDKYTKNTKKSVEILNNVLGVDKETALLVMTTKYNLSTTEAQNVLKYTHPDNPSPFVLITSGDMVGKAGWWSYFGSWDFKKNQGQHYIYSAGMATPQFINNTTVIQAENGVIAQINETEILAGLLTEQGIIKPHKIIMIQDDRITKDQLVFDESPFTIFLIKEESTYLTIVMNKELEDSMFTKMFFMNGTDLKMFSLIHREPNVLVWKVS